MSAGVDKTNVLLDEERRLASHQEVKASIDNDVNGRIKRESARLEPRESAEVAGVARELKQKSVHEAVSTERELERGRTAARVSQVVDYVFLPHLRPDRLRVFAGTDGCPRRQRIRSVAVKSAALNKQLASLDIHVSSANNVDTAPRTTM